MHQTRLATRTAVYRCWWVRLRHALAGLSLLVVLPCYGDAPKVTTNGETLIGKWSEVPAVSAFLGVPFAQPPLGDLRWREPLDYSGNGEIRQATQFAPACMQSPRILDWYRDLVEHFGGDRRVFPDLAVSENCLYLNVWTPTLDAAAKLPVMVFIHGGSNKSGWSFEPNYYGHALAKEGVVVVTIAYRMGVFGFFSHPDLSAATAKANFGLWDQLTALRWIQQHIGDFGGDPTRVTLFGQSAGAQDAAALMLSPRADGLFQRAILESAAGVGLPHAATLADEQARGAAFARALNAKTPPSLAEMRKIPAELLLAQAESISAGYYHAPVVDGSIVTGQTREILDEGRYPVRQLMIGTNANEWYSYLPEHPDSQTLDAALRDAAVLRTSEVRTLLGDSPDLRITLDRLQTAEDYHCPSQYLAARVAGTGRPTWMYLFSRVREGQAAAALKAYHEAELAYVFGTHDAWLPTNETDRQLTVQIMRYWVQFAKTGNPNSGEDPRWPAFANPHYAVQELGDRVRSIATPEPALCRVYTKLLDPLQKQETGN